MSCIYFLGNRIIGFFLLFFLSVRLFDWAKTLIQSFFYLLLLLLLLSLLLLFLKTRQKEISNVNQKERENLIWNQKNKHVQSQNV